MLARVVSVFQHCKNLIKTEKVKGRKEAKGVGENPNETPFVFIYSSVAVLKQRSAQEQWAGTLKSHCRTIKELKTMGRLYRLL
jgi:hypothetical protein